MNLALLILDRESTRAGRLRSLRLPSSPMVLGRSAEADLELNDPALALKHLRLGPKGAWVEDLGGRNGTRLNGKRLPAGRPVPLRSGDELEAGPFRIRLVEPDGCRKKTACLDLLGGSGRTEFSGWLLTQLSGEQSGRRLKLRPGQDVILGRSAACEWVLDDKRISRRHLLLRCDARGGLSCRDLGSTNGFRLDGRCRRRARRLRSGSRLAIGRFEFELRRVERSQAVAAGSWTAAWFSKTCAGFQNESQPSSLLILSVFGLALTLALSAGWWL